MIKNIISQIIALLKNSTSLPLSYSITLVYFEAAVTLFLILIFGWFLWRNKKSTSRNQLSLGLFLLAGGLILGGVCRHQASFITDTGLFGISMVLSTVVLLSETIVYVVGISYITGKSSSRFPVTSLGLYYVLLWLIPLAWSKMALSSSIALLIVVLMIAVISVVVYLRGDRILL